MGQDITLECEDLLPAAPRLKIVLPSRCHSAKVDDRDRKQQSSGRYCHFEGLDGAFRESSLSCSRSSHRRSTPSRKYKVDINDNEVPKRGSMYQSSKEVRRMRKLREGRRKTDPAYSNDDFLSFEIIDSLPQPSSNEVDPFSQIKRSSLLPINAEAKSPSVSSTNSTISRSMDFLDLSFRDLPEEPLDPKSSCFSFVSTKSSSADIPFEISLHSEDNARFRAKVAPELLESGSCRELRSNYNGIIGPEDDANAVDEKDRTKSLPKSMSAKVGMFDLTSQSSCALNNVSIRNRFSPLKRMLDPIIKSKSQRNPSLVETETAESMTIDPACLWRNGIPRKSLLNNFSTETRELDCDTRLREADQVLTTATSPAHLHGILKLESRNGSPLFEFSVKDPDDVLSAKTWKTNNAFNWVYTFHSRKKKISGNGRVSKDKHGQSLSSMVGQMQVSCYLCSEVRENGSLDHSTVTEFVLYDIGLARRSFAIEERQNSSDSSRAPSSSVVDSLVRDSPLERSNSMDRQHPVRHGCSSCDSDTSTSYPWSPADLNPHLEIAAIVIQIPFSKKENSKNMKAEEISEKDNLHISSAKTIDRTKKTISNSLNPAIMKVITPSGTHGLPSTEEGGPSSLLDRWRDGGGCDCGGWDMGCSIAVFGNPRGEGMAGYLTKDGQQQMVLFVEGSKDRIPAISIVADENGQYLVDFHAQLSSIQAFSICIAILHSSEASSAGQGNNKQRLYSNSLKLLLEEEVRHLIEAVAVEEKRKVKKKVEHNPSSFILDPPFSPMGRV